MAKNLIHKFVAILIIFLLLAGTLALAFGGPTAHASNLSDIGDFFQQEDGGLTFTDYQGGVVELSTAGYDSSLTTSTDARSYILRIVNFALGFLGLIAVIIIIYGGVLYVTSGGESDSTDKGKNAIKYAAIGLLIVLGSFALVNTIIKGAGGAGDGTGEYIVGPNQGGSFNASATEVRTIAREIYTSFLLFAESYEDVKNIKADLEKPQLDYQQDSAVTKGDQLAFLESAKSKLLNIRSRVPKFSETYAQINNLVRFLENYIAQISIIGRNETDGPDTFVEKRFATWERFRAAFLSEDDKTEGALISLVNPIKNDFKVALNQGKDKIAAINTNLGPVESATGSIQTLYAKLTEAYTLFEGDVDSWALNNPADEIDKAGQRLYVAIQATVEYEKAIRELKSVIARLRADVVNGNAPLYVNFDVLESIDPAGGSIVEVDWTRIDGSRTLDNQVIDTFPRDAVDCKVVTNEKEIIGKTFRQCIFKYPGTYLATVIVNSNDPTKYVSGLSTLTIKVNPPTTKINLELAISEQKIIPIIQYYNSGILKFDKDLIPVTLEEAKAGLQFNSKISNVTNYRWDFGDGTIKEGPQEINANHAYTIAGRYLVTLEVTNQLSQIDRKIFTVDVGNVAGRINVSPPGELFINNPVRFSAEQSSSVGGSIRGYEWSVTPEGGQPIDLGANSGRASFNYEFTEPGVYLVKLRVVSQAGIGDAPELRITLKSKPPVAVIKSTIPKKNQPATIQLNGSGSFDPDGPVENLAYEWRITPDSQNGENWQVLDSAAIDGVITIRDPIIKFKKPGDYDITLKAIDKRTVDTGIDPEFTTDTIKLTVDRVLDVDWAADQQVTALIDANGLAKMDFSILSDNAVAYEVDFGDGETENGQMSGAANFSHQYTSSGRYEVEVRVYDSNDDDNIITRRFFIGGGDTPVARASLLVASNEILNLNEPIKVSTSDLLTFDASQSKNTDGTGRDLNYQWDFGDLKTSSKKNETHKYKELSPARDGFYTVKLRVSDKDNPSKFDEDEIYIDVINKPPFFSSVQGQMVQEQDQGKPITPVQFDMRAYGAIDEDGQVVKYKWWYFDVDDPNEQLGVRITNNESTRLTIGTRGREGQEITYGFGLEITDDSGMSYSNQDEIDSDNFSSVQVVNGKNALPVAKFSASATSVFVGDTVVLTSSSTDADGQIATYIWDLEGDGFFNNIPSDKPSVEYQFPEKNLDGLKVRLKVIDDKGGESVSEPITITVDSNAKPPKAAFRYQVVDGSKGMKVQFTNNSTVDTEAGAEILALHWDFDTASTLESADSDGDGKKDNDIDSQQAEPSRLYTKAGKYSVKLTVTDTQGNKNSVTNTLNLPLSKPPTAAFKYRIVDDKVVFENNSTPDPEAKSTLEKYIWDFDIDSDFPTADTNGDGDLENDKDSELKSPVYTYPNPGTYEVKLTVIDSQGSEDEVVNTIIFTGLPGSIGSSINGQTSTPTPNNTTPSNIKALLKTLPQASADAILYLSGNSTQVKFDFSKSLGEIVYFVIDKNILLDTNGDGIADNDEDFKTTLPGTWTTTFERKGGRIISRLTVVDRSGGTDSSSQEIIFQ